MTNFKSGAGNLDFDAEDEDSTPDESASEPDSAAGEDSGSPTERSTGGLAADRARSSDDGETYPYFVRRSNVGDERDTRLEIHVRDKVAEGEAQFRHALAEELGASDVSKTDAREFALLAAFRNPERVAELMRAEGFDSLP